MSYFNTTNLNGEDLKQQRRKAVTQDEAILRIFTTFNAPFTASQVEDYLKRAGKSWPITSIRRSISGLHKAGRLEKGEKITGPYGVPEYQWRHRKDQEAA
mgnify:CR=1 FL=1